MTELFESTSQSSRLCKGRYFPKVNEISPGSLKFRIFLDLRCTFGFTRSYCICRSIEKHVGSNLVVIVHLFLTVYVVCYG